MYVQNCDYQNVKKKQLHFLNLTELIHDQTHGLPLNCSGLEKGFSFHTRTAGGHGNIIQSHP